jgi:2-keto-4-pentenoate hydratase/2-oxohepta-3-ene-1,7-dioic acid hydratase in catechol pathway
MRIVRFVSQGKTRHGLLQEKDQVQPLADSPFENIHPEGEILPLDQVTILAPCLPSKIVAVGLNYRDHAEEVGMPIPEEPMLFMKPGTAVIGPGGKIIIPEMSERVDYEAELGVVMGKRIFRASKEDARKAILGYTCVNDVTARDLQMKDIQFTRAKGFDTFAPMGPWIETDLDPQALAIETFLNGEQKQKSSTSQLVFDSYHLVHFISWIMTLNPGDVIATGTPAGIGPMQAGDRVEVRVEGIGSLVNEVALPEKG